MVRGAEDNRAVLLCDSPFTKRESPRRYPDAVTGWDQGHLSAQQSAFVARSLDQPRLLDDLSWGLTDTKVLRVRAADCDLIVKAAGPRNHHIGREITAYENYAAPLSRHDRAGELVGASRSLNVLIASFHPGELIEGLPAECDPDVHRQAGLVLRALHEQQTRLDDEYEARMTAKAGAWLDHQHRISPGIEAEARKILGTYRPQPIEVVPTHGDWQPRNWLIDFGRLRVIDFGRFAFRSAATDLCRLAVQQWRGAPGLEAAFLAGYGEDPRDARVWSIELLREAIGTAVWAFQVGDTEFESQGHRMLSEAIDRF